MTAIRPSVRLSQGDLPRATRAPTRVVRAGAKPVDGFDSGKPAVKRTVLQRGMTGAQVRGLQQKLLAKGFLNHRDVASGPGVFGPRTEAGVKRAQAAFGLPVTGVAGTSLLAALNGDLFRAANDETPTRPIPSLAVHRQLAQTISDNDEPTTPMGEGLLEANAAS